MSHNWVSSQIVVLQNLCLNALVWLVNHDYYFHFLEFIKSWYLLYKFLHVCRVFLIFQSTEIATCVLSITVGG
jgi:hypothetical protein